MANPTAAVGPPIFYQGLSDASHTATVAIVYLSSSLLTPWPFYHASMGLSLLTVYLEYVTTFLHDDDDDGDDDVDNSDSNDGAHHGGSPSTAATLAVSHDTIAAAAAPTTAPAGISPGVLRRIVAWPVATTAAMLAAGRQRRCCIARRIAVHVPLLIATARTAGTLGLAVRFVRQCGDGGARRPALSSIAALLFSVLSCANGHHSHLALALAAADVLALYASAFVLGFGHACSDPGVSYGNVVTTSGCPPNVTAAELQDSRFAGCGLPAVGGLGRALDGGPAAYLELIFHVVAGPLYIGLFMIAVYFLVAQLLVGLDWVGARLCGCRRRYPCTPTAVVRKRECRLRNRHDRFSDFGSDDITLADVAIDAGGVATTVGTSGSHSGSRVANGDDLLGWPTRDVAAALCVTAFIGIVLYSTFYFPAHYVQQTRRRMHSVYVSASTPVMVSGETSPSMPGVTIWSDWFRVAQPAHRFGYLGIWWREYGRQWDTLLAFL
jgi:hypothetical protein